MAVEAKLIIFNFKSYNQNFIINYLSKIFIDMESNIKLQTLDDDNNDQLEKEASYYHNNEFDFKELKNWCDIDMKKYKENKNST